jgi:hypothetical protein
MLVSAVAAELTRNAAAVAAVGECWVAEFLREKEEWRAFVAMLEHGAPDAAAPAAAPPPRRGASRSARTPAAPPPPPPRAPPRRAAPPRRRAAAPPPSDNHAAAAAAPEEAGATEKAFTGRGAAFTPEEDAQLLAAHARHGRKWALIGRLALAKVAGYELLARHVRTLEGNKCLRKRFDRMARG